MEFTKEHAFGMVLGLGIGIGCIIYGMAKAETSVRIDARLLPFVGMDRYKIEAVCYTDNDCEEMEERLQAAGWRYEPIEAEH